MTGHGVRRDSNVTRSGSVSRKPKRRHRTRRLQRTDRALVAVTFTPCQGQDVRDAELGGDRFVQYVQAMTTDVLPSA